MDSLQTKIIQQIEAYITEDNLKDDAILGNCAEENDGWIRLELLSRCKKLSCYSYDQILHALSSGQLQQIELSTFIPRCIRRRCQLLRNDSIQDNRTVIVNGLPHDIGCEDLIAFFNRFYPIEEIKMFPASHRFNGRIHVVFNQSPDAFAFVQQSKLSSIIYTKDYLNQSSNGCTLSCKLLNDEIHQDSIQPDDQHGSIRGKSFSTRLANHSSHVSFKTNIPLTADIPVHEKSSSLHSQTRPCLKSTSCATEQILFCQNLSKNQTKSITDTKHNMICKKFSYDFYIPDHLLKQTHECIIISVLNPQCFTIQLKQDALQFDKFQREINEFYNAIDDRQYHFTSEQIRMNLCVICSDMKSSEKTKIWNRSQILDFDPADKTVNLFYVDLGTWEEYVPINRLRHITDRFHQHQVFSLTCRLAHILPCNNDNDSCTWNDEATNQFIAVVDQATAQLEFLSFTTNGCIQTNLSVINSNQPVCVNDYMVHIRQAKATINTGTKTTMKMDDDGQSSIQSEEHDDNDTRPSIHPVIALYNKLGETLPRPLTDSRTTSISSSSMSSPSTLSQLHVKLIHVNIDNNIINRQKYNNQKQILPIIFVRYRKTILIPDFNICTLLQITNPHINIHTIENYASSIKYNGVHITAESHFDIFTQLRSLHDRHYSNRITLYPLDFVDYILEDHQCRITNVLLVLENAKYAQLQVSDLALWFAMDNELRLSSTPTSSDSAKHNHLSDQTVPISPIHEQSPVPIRLLFSNRLINPI